jgi:hypothetical protein
MNHSARRANALAKHLGARRYLEIGVSSGGTFRDIEIAERTGVDPKFAFNTNEFTNEFTRFVETTSDEFFVKEPLFPPYDIVFVDGLHTFEQVLRDFSNAILHTQRRSVIIFDDTVPSDVYSSIPDQTSALFFRKRADGSNNDKSWHGDVFKIVFYIHDFWPSLNYRTIAGSGNPQTIVWRSNNVSRQPLLNNLEKISRLTYFDLREYSSVLQTTTEDEAIALCIAETKTL